jgi:uncharacterized integral membrane protein
MGLIRWIFGFIISVALAAFAVANRQSIDIYWSPVHNAATLPVYLVVLTAMAAGFLIGAIIVWFSLIPVRFKSWRQGKIISRLQKEKLVNSIAPENTTHTTLPAKIGNSL